LWSSSPTPCRPRSATGSIETLPKRRGADRGGADELACRPGRTSCGLFADSTRPLRAPLRSSPHVVDSSAPGLTGGPERSAIQRCTDEDGARYRSRRCGGPAMPPWRRSHRQPLPGLLPAGSTAGVSRNRMSSSTVWCGCSGCRSGSSSWTTYAWLRPGPTPVKPKQTHPGHRVPAQGPRTTREATLRTAGPARG
jgi:hypothetical protein